MREQQRGEGQRIGGYYFPAQIAIFGIVVNNVGKGKPAGDDRRA
jgi:hypothetical protein